ncbi:hypothetical protein GmHk_08G024219 [Glycine max]|nr:hypothetical protein GmHk_08G024219 [Glycine max]
MTVAQSSDPPANAPDAQPRHVPQVPESNIPQVPDDPTRSDVDEPKHAVIGGLRCDRREVGASLSLGLVTPGTSTHEVIKECLKITRSVTQDRIVYVRSQHRRRMNQP